MPDVTREFWIIESVKDARARVECELARGIETRSFRKQASDGDVLTFEAQAPSWLSMGSPSVAVWWNFFLGKRFVTFAFEPERSGTKVKVKGRVSKALAVALEALGRPGRWPDTDHDPDWLER